MVLVRSTCQNVSETLQDPHMPFKNHWTEINCHAQHYISAEHILLRFFIYGQKKSAIQRQTTCSSLLAEVSHLVS